MGSKKCDDQALTCLNHEKNHSSSASDSDSRDSLIPERLKKKLLKKLKKLKKKERKKKRKKERKKETKSREKQVKKYGGKKSVDGACNTDSAVLQKSEAYAPMTKEEWDRQQNTLKRVFDEETGRTRLIRGSGEIVEECVSRERQLQINKQATKSDGEYFQKVLASQK